MDQKRITILIKSSLISLAYVALGTVAVLSSYPSSPLYGEWVLPTTLITFPVSIWSFGIMFADSHAFWLVIIVQSIVFFIFWLILFRWMQRKLKKHSI
ncbi:hypothetical protein [Mucilaginibacter sp.]|uniref:hypothetical protein n=1 Tax=Mucilaginibacter sp. TaxID=1882438 RepID=UPI003D0E7C6B